MQENKYDPLDAYQASKLANVYHCLELSKQLQGDLLVFGPQRVGYHNRSVLSSEFASHVTVSHIYDDIELATSVGCTYGWNNCISILCFKIEL